MYFLALDEDGNISSFGELNESECLHLINSLQRVGGMSISNSTSGVRQMDRIEEIGLQRPEWAVELNNFLERFPEFQRFRQIAPLDATIPKTTDDEKDPQTIFETIIYYVANAGVRFSYALEQFELLRVFIRNYDWQHNLYYLQWFLHTYNIQPKKKDILEYFLVI